MKNREFWDKSGKLLLALALVIGIVSLSINLITLFMERQRAASAYTAYPSKPKQEDVRVINVLSAGAVDIRDGYDEVYDKSFSGLTSVFSNSDLAVFNMIPLVGTEVPDSFGDALVASGIDAVSLANPRCLAGGKRGIDISLSYWLSNDVETSGTYGATDEQNRIPVFERNGIRISFLAFTDMLDDELPDHERYLVNVYDDVRTPEIVAKAAAQADIVIVSVWWQGQDASGPLERQRSIAESLADAGASVILGNAEDAVQPAEWIDDTLVYYSLGSLFTDSEDAYGVIGAVTVTKTTTDDLTKIELTNPRVDVCKTVFTDTDAQVQLFEGSELAEEEKDTYERFKGILQKLDDSIRIGGLQ